MTGEDVKALRESIGRRLGRRLSQRDLCQALGLSVANNPVRDWEERGPSGPGAVALALIDLALGSDHDAARKYAEGLFQ